MCIHVMITRAQLEQTKNWSLPLIHLPYHGKKFGIRCKFVILSFAFQTFYELSATNIGTEDLTNCNTSTSMCTVNGATPYNTKLYTGC